jgi:hypothetical protein
VLDTPALRPASIAFGHKLCLTPATPCITRGKDWICPPQLLATAFGHLLNPKSNSSEPVAPPALWHSFGE